MAINTRPQYNAAPPAKPKSGRPYTLLGAVLAVLGFGMVLLFNSLSGSHAAAPSAVATSPVVVAARDIALRTPLAPDDVKVVKFAVGDVPPGALTKLDEAKGMVAGVSILKGQPLTSNLLVKAGDAVAGPQPGYLSIPSGWVALTVPTSEQTGVAGYINTGDYISIVGTVTGRNGENVRTLFTNVHVLRVGPAAADAAPAGQGSNAAKTSGITSSLTVVVTQCQAEYLGWFIANAKISYTLESYKDYKPQDVAVDATCPSVSSANGVTRDNVASRWPGVFN